MKKRSKKGATWRKEKVEESRIRTDRERGGERGIEREREGGGGGRERERDFRYEMFI